MGGPRSTLPAHRHSSLGTGDEGIRARRNPVSIRHRQGNRSPARSRRPSFGVRGQSAAATPLWLTRPSTCHGPLVCPPGQLPGSQGRDSSRSLTRKPKRHRRSALPAHSIFRGGPRRLLPTRAGSWRRSTSETWRRGRPRNLEWSDPDGTTRHRPNARQHPGLSQIIRPCVASPGSPPRPSSLASNREPPAP